jgi:hypothetical protein
MGWEHGSSVEYFPSKCKALSSNPCTVKNKTKIISSYPTCIVRMGTCVAHISVVVYVDIILRIRKQYLSLGRDSFFEILVCSVV